jgi:hypothetical protein
MFGCSNFWTKYPKKGQPCPPVPAAPDDANLTPLSSVSRRKLVLLRSFLYSAEARRFEIRASVSLAAMVIGVSLVAMVIGLSFNNRTTTTTAMMHPIQARMYMTPPKTRAGYNRENARRQPVKTGLQNV